MTNWTKTLIAAWVVAIGIGATQANAEDWRTMTVIEGESFEEYKARSEALQAKEEAAMKDQSDAAFKCQADFLGVENYVEADGLRGTKEFREKAFSLSAEDYTALTNVCYEKVGSDFRIDVQQVREMLLKVKMEGY